MQGDTHLPSYDLIVRNARLASGDALDLAVAGGRVVARAPGLRVTAAIEIDAEGRLVLPGFVDPHLHLDKALSRSELPEEQESLASAIAASRRVKAGWTEDAIEARAARAVEMALRAGTTVLRTHVDVDPVIGLRGFHALLRVRERFAGRARIQIVAFPQEGLADGVEAMLDRALREGADVPGGIPARERDPRAHIDRIFALARAHDTDIDMHVDESDDPADLSLEYLAEKTVAEGYEGRVVAGHCTSLAALPRPVLDRVLGKVKAAGISVVTLPSTNLHLQGREDAPPVRRGLAPVRRLLEAGVNVVYGSDNIRDPFTPFGNARMLELGLLLAHAAHLGTSAGLRAIVQMATHHGAAALRLPDYGLDVGHRADIVIVDADSPEEALVSVAPALHVIVGGVPVGGLHLGRP
jgi:cytosine deaminase